MFNSWLENRYIDFKYTIRLIKNWRNLKRQNNKYSPICFFLFQVLYPIPRLFFGREKASRGIIKRFLGKDLIIPLPLKSPKAYFIRVRDEIELDIFREVCIKDHYNFSQLKSGMVVVDIGAHIGTFTLSASLKVGKEGKVIAIEPENGNFNQLNKNLILNKIENVVPVNIGISDSNGEKDFFITSNYVGHSLSPHWPFINKIRIKVKTLDTLLKELNINKIDMLKIDVEGAELEILKGAKETLIKNPRLKIAIASYHYPGEVQEIIEYLKKMNFSPEIHPEDFTIVAVK